MIRANSPTNDFNFLDGDFTDSKDANLAWRYFEYKNEHYQGAQLLCSLVYSESTHLIEKIEKIAKIMMLLKCIAVENTTKDIEEFKIEIKNLNTVFYFLKHDYTTESRNCLI